MTSLFDTSAPPVQAAPIIPSPVVMPTENSAAIQEAKQKQLQAAATSSGRSSTILSMNNNQNAIDKTDTLG